MNIEKPDSLKQIAQYDTGIYTNTDEKHLGSYRIGKNLMARLMRRKVYGARNGTRELMKNVTNRELEMLILLLQIADNNNYIDSLSMREVLEYSHANGQKVVCEKTYYNTLHGLCEKGYLRYEKTGTRYNIQVLHNDIMPHERYLNLNRNIFIYGEEQELKFSALSLGAKKMTLYLLYCLAPGATYQGNLKHLQKMLGLKTTALMTAYLNEIETVLGPISRLSSDMTKKANGRFLLTAENRTKAAPNSNQTLKKHQANYMRRCFKRLCKLHSVELDKQYVIKSYLKKQKQEGNNHLTPPDSTDVENYYSSRLYGLLEQSYKHLKEKRKIFSIIEYILAETHLLSHQTLTEINYLLNLEY